MLKLLALWTLVAFASVVPTAPAGAMSVTTPPAGYSALLARRVAGTPNLGIIAGVIDNDRTTFAQAGSSGTDTPLNAHTLFEIGSVTKTFTATLLATMVLDGSVKLDDPVQRYMPAGVTVPQYEGRSITLLDLATQRSGLPRLPTNMQPADPADPYADYTTAKLYAFLNGYALPRAPGAQFEYSNLGVGLLGVALSNAARRPYADLLRERVLAPLDMRETAIVLDATLGGRFAVGHDADGAAVKPWHLDALAAAGGLRSSVADLLKFARCNLGSGPLARACLFAQQPRAEIPGGHIGLVWWIDDDGAIVHHGGDTAGFHAEIAIAADHRRAAVVLSNGGGLGVEDLARHALVAGTPVAQPQAAKTLDAATLEHYVGTYAMSGVLAGSTLAITRAGDGLSAQLSGQPAARIYPDDPDRFVYHVVAATIAFARDANGRIIGLVLRQNGQSFAGTLPGASVEAVLAGQPSAPASVHVAPQTLAAYAGTYVAGPTLRFVVYASGDDLMVKLNDQDGYAVYASSPDHFFYKVVDAKITFERGSDGRVVGLSLLQNGRTLEAVRQAAP